LSDGGDVVYVFDDEVYFVWYPADPCVGSYEHQSVICLVEAIYDVYVVVLGTGASLAVFLASVFACVVCAYTGDTGTLEG
jgi:hypothetical protein